MLEKFIQGNKAENIRRWLGTIDLRDADILKTERDIYAALSKSQKNTTWQATPIAPFAEPVDLNALVGDLFTESKEEINYHIQRLDNLYAWLSDTNNLLKSEIESSEKAVLEATNNIQDISIVVGDENRNFYWVSDSFNNNSFVDKVSTCLVDTDYGMVSLGPKELQSVLGFEASIDKQVTNGIPGANLYVLSLGNIGLPDKELNPIGEKTDTRNLGAIFDADPSTWFEIERNFIPPKQKVKMQGRSFLFSESGEEKDVKEVTVNYDWKGVITWPDGVQDGGSDGKGKDLVEWRNLDTENPVATNSVGAALGSNPNDPKVVLALDLILKEPTSISSIKILPFIREDSGLITIELIQVFTDGQAVDVSKDVELGTNKSTTKLQREILRRTGIQLIGSVIPIPTDRDITKVRIILSSKPSLTKNGLLHIFKDVFTEHRTERNHVFFRSVNKWKEWSRHPYNETVPIITSSNARPGIVGTLLNLGTNAYAVGSIFSQTQQDLNANSVAKNVAASKGGVFNALGAVSAGINAAKIGGTIGSVGTWLGAQLPIIGAVLALDQLVGGFFSVKKSTNVLESRVGFDVFRGHRSAIALRDVSLLKTTYTSESFIQSVKRVFPGPVTKVGLFVDEYVPDYWGPGEWLTYFVSTNGVDWQSIPKLTDTTIEKSLVLKEPTTTIFFKAVLKGNLNDIYHSPQLRHYSLQGLAS